MFDKTQNKLTSFIGPECEFKGEMKVKGILRIDGSVAGKIQADRLILSETADVKGDVRAVSIIVGGRMEGNLRASDLVEIRAEGSVKGDVFTDKLLVTEGGEFNGRIEMVEGATSPLKFESPETEAAAKLS